MDLSNSTRTRTEPWMLRDAFILTPIEAANHLLVGDIVASLFAPEKNRIDEDDIEPTSDPQEAVLLTFNRVLGVIPEAQSILYFEEQLGEGPADVEVCKLNGANFLATAFCGLIGG